MSIRCFIAIELESGIKKELARLQERLRRELPVKEGTVKWVKPDNIHLTLKFLGEVADSIIPDICSAVTEATGGHEAFDFDVSDLGCFPPKGSARVIWAGIRSDSQALQPLQENLESILETLEFPRENRKFSAHLTLARIKNAQVGRLVQDTVKNLGTISLGRQSVSRITVFQSDLTRSGPIYTALHHAPLRAT